MSEKRVKISHKCCLILIKKKYQTYLNFRSILACNFNPKNKYKQYIFDYSSLKNIYSVGVKQDTKTRNKAKDKVKVSVVLKFKFNFKFKFKFKVKARILIMGLVKVVSLMSSTTGSVTFYANYKTSQVADQNFLRKTLGHIPTIFYSLTYYYNER